MLRSSKSLLGGIPQIRVGLPLQVLVLSPVDPDFIKGQVQSELAFIFLSFRLSDSSYEAHSQT